METLRKIKRWLDGLFIWFFGRRVLLCNVVINRDKVVLYHEDREKEWESPSVELYGFYTLPDLSNLSYFGIDTQDEMELELNHADTIKKLGKIPDIGSKIITLDNGKREWIIIQRNIEDHRMWGSGRLAFALQRYVESVTTGSVSKSAI